MGNRELKEAKFAKEGGNDIHYLCNQILHIIKVCGEKAWNHICLGSDFDGFILPIKDCETARELPHLEKLLMEELPKMMECDGTYEYDKTDLEDKVRKFMFDNAFRFLNRYFTVD